MKTLENKKFPNGAEEISYANLLKLCVNQTPKEGFSPSDMRTRLRILDVLEKANGTIELEDSDSKITKDLVAQMKWTILSKDILTFTDEVEASFK